MTDPTPLYIYPFDRWSEYRDVFRRAKTASSELAKISLQPKEAHPGCQRIVALNEHPPFASEYALVRRLGNELPQELALVILRWYCGVQDDSRVFTHEQWLSRVLGVAVKGVVG